MEVYICHDGKGTLIQKAVEHERVLPRAVIRCHTPQQRHLLRQAAINCLRQARVKNLAGLRFVTTQFGSRHIHACGVGCRHYTLAQEVHWGFLGGWHRLQELGLVLLLYGEGSRYYQEYTRNKPLLLRDK